METVEVTLSSPVKKLRNTKKLPVEVFQFILDHINWPDGDKFVFPFDLNVEDRRYATIYLKDLYKIIQVKRDIP